MNILCKLARFYVTQNMLILTVFVNVLLVTYSVIYGANFVTNFIAIINNDLHTKALLSQLTFLIIKLTERLK